MLAVAARHQPAAVLVALAQVKAEGHAGRRVDHRVVQLDAIADPALGAPAARLVEGPPLGVDQQRVVGCVQLDVGAPEALQLAHLVDEHPCHSAHEVVEARVGLPRALGIPEVGEQAGARKRDLGGPVGDRPEEGELLGRERAAALQRPHHGHLVRALDRLVAELVGVPLAPQPGVDAHSLKAVDGLAQLGLERLAAVLTVAEHGQAHLFLHSHDVANCVILSGLQAGWGIPSLQQLRRAQQAPHMLGPSCDRPRPGRTGAAGRRWSARGSAASRPSARAPRRTCAPPCARAWPRSRFRGRRTPRSGARSPRRA